MWLTNKKKKFQDLFLITNLVDFYYAGVRAMNFGVRGNCEILQLGGKRRGIVELEGESEGEILSAIYDRYWLNYWHNLD